MEKEKFELVKSADFYGSQCDVYSDGSAIGMTAYQLGSCLGYSNPRESINKIVARNKYLSDDEFSVEVKLTSTDNKQYETRLFTEDGIYEVTMLAKTKKAKKFRQFIRNLLKSIRNGSYTQNDY